MGLFASLFGNPEPSNVELVPDQIWLTQGAKLDGLQRLLVQPGTQAADAILIAAHFDDVLGELIRIEEAYQGEKLRLMRNFLGGLTNHKIIELYKMIALLKFEGKLGYKLENRDKLVDKNSVESFEKKLKKQSQRLLKKK